MTAFLEVPPMRTFAFAALQLFFLTAMPAADATHAIPPSLQKFAHQHPRLFLNQNDVLNLRQEIKTTKADLWQETISTADGLMAKGPPPYHIAKDRSDNESLWQRKVGNAMPFLALAYLMTEDRRYLDSARIWALAACAYPTWGYDRDENIDLASGHLLFGLSIVYDWCYDGLGDEARATIRSMLIRHGSIMFDAANSGRVFWWQSFLQNHMWVNITGLATAGLAIFDEYPDAMKWVDLAAAKFKRTMETLGPDGASHEGIGYWGYGVEYMLKYMWLSRELLGVSLYDCQWWRNTASYRIYLGLPEKAWSRTNNIVDLADCARFSWYGPDYLLRGLAREYGDRRAQWLAEELDASKIGEDGNASWLNLLWQEQTVKPLAPGEIPALPTLHQFADMDIVSARSDWSGNESLVVFKCGPYIGHKAIRDFTFDPGGGHVHPDANHFVIFGAGDWLIRNDGYRSKWTGQENTLLINGIGQIGEGKAWFDGKACLTAHAEPHISRAIFSPALDVMTGEAERAYPVASGLTRYHRHLLFLKPDVLIVIDDIALKQQAALELRFHPEHAAQQRDGSAFMSQGNAAMLRVDSLTSDGVSLSSETIAGQSRSVDTKAFSMDTIRMTRVGSEWRNAVAFSWCKAAGIPPIVHLKEEGTRWIFNVGSRTVIFDWRDESVH